MGKTQLNIIPKQEANWYPMKAKWYVLFRTELLHSAQPSTMKRKETGSIVLVWLYLLNFKSGGTDRGGILCLIVYFSEIFEKCAPCTRGKWKGAIKVPDAWDQAYFNSDFLKINCLNVKLTLRFSSSYILPVCKATIKTNLSVLKGT